MVLVLVVRDSIWRIYILQPLELGKFEIQEYRTWL